MKAYQMTLAYYQAMVTPLLQELVKFGKKNKQYYIGGDYRGLILVDFAEATRITCHGEWLKMSLETREEYMTERWEKQSGVKPVRVIPAQIQNEYKCIINALLEELPEGKVVLKDHYNNTVGSDEVKSNKRMVKDAIDNGTYAELIESGEMTVEEVQEVLDSVKVRMPKSLDEKVKEFKRRIEFKKNPIMQQFMDMILASFQAERDAYYARFFEVYSKQIERYIAAHNESKRSSDHEDAKRLVSQNILANWYKLFQYAKDGNSIERTVNFDEQFIIMLNYILDKRQEELVNTMCLKVEMVLSMLVSVEQIYMQMGDLGLEGSFKFILTNGSFIIDTQAIFAEGEINRAHFRYIAHYKQVVMDGKSYGTQNFEQMTKLFGQIL